MLEIEETCKIVGRDPKSIKLIAVTKYVSTSRAIEAIRVGIKHIGENRSEGLKSKRDAIKADVSWHFIGSLQTRKVKEILDQVDYIHSLDRLSLAEEIQKRASSCIKCFVQVNTSGEKTKQGLAIEEVDGFLNSIKDFDNLQVIGLMTMAPYTNDEDIIRNSFKELRLLRDLITNKNYKNAPCTFLSMGMSNDYKIAIEEGATHIRIGSLLVGEEI
ncbi:MAG: alanine racemase domain protein [Bacillales bacterium]|jgi:pyridoxal phosphate enzyme (YggS family)|nr:alanine racemase domain protein [Bacillales bacterium]